MLKTKDQQAVSSRDKTSVLIYSVVECDTQKS